MVEAGIDYSIFFIVAIVSIFLLMGIFFLVKQHFAKKRREALKAFAVSRGYTFKETFDPQTMGTTQNIELSNIKDAKLMTNIPEEMKAAAPKNIYEVPAFSLFGIQLYAPWPFDKLPWLKFELFAKQNEKRITNYLEKIEPNSEQRIFDFTCIVVSRSSKGGTSRREYSQTPIIIRTQKKIPQFVLTKEGILGKLADLVGFNDIDFDSNPEFSKKCRLKGKDESQIRACFTPQILNYFASNLPFGNIESNEEYILFYTPSKKFSPEELPRLIDEAVKITAMFY